jgi:PKHD-type hydroxylase
MNLQNYFYYFKNALTPRFCDEVIKYGTAQQEQLALTGALSNKKIDDKAILDLKKKRNSNIVWMNDRWIYNEIQPFIHQANKLAGWNFDWDFSESCQFTKYKLNQFYDWHCD